MNYYAVPGLPKKIKQHTINNLVKLTCEYFNVKPNDFIYNSRKRELVEARFFFYWYGYKHQLYTYKALGLATNGRHHTTVLHGISTLENLCFSDSRYKKILADYKFYLSRKLY
jgi:chromosomal replication initiator protein